MTPVDERDDLDVKGCFTNTTFSPPTGLEFLATRQYFGPAITEKVGHEDDEGSLNRDVRGLELVGGQ